MQRHLRRISRREEPGEIGKPGEQVDDAQPADRAAHEIVREDGPQRRPAHREVVVLPERGPPRHHDEQQADLDEKDDVEKAADQRSAPRLNFGEVILIVKENRKEAREANEASESETVEKAETPRIGLSKQIRILHPCFRRGLLRAVLCE